MPPYSERSVLPGESSNSSVSIESDTASGSLSAASTPSPTDLEISVDADAEVSELQKEIFETEILDPIYYPTPGDLMPFDHAFPDFLRQITNERNLANVFSLKLRIISRYVSLQRMSLYTVNLRELNLEGSILSSLRDIGSNLKFLQILKVGNCQLDSLDGTFGLTSLRQLYAQKNFISDVTPCSNLPYIQHIDLSSNRIRNIAYAGFLTVCRKLKSIVFTGNPAAKLSDYRSYVRRILPQIESLDNIMFGSEETVDMIILNNELPFEEENYFPEANEDDHYEIYNNSFEGGSKHSVLNISETFEKVIKTNENSNIVEDIPELQEILKHDRRCIRSKDSHLLSLRKEKDECLRIKSLCLSQGKKIDFEETEKISDNCSSFNTKEIEEEIDSLSLPPLCTNEKKVIPFEKETFFLKAVNGKNLKETNTKIDFTCETSTSCTAVADNIASSAFNSEEEDKRMGARARVLSKSGRPYTASNTQLSLNDQNGSFENHVDLQKRPASASSGMLNEHENSRETISKCSKFKSLTTGLPMCGNLAVALRNRKKYQQDQEDVELSKYDKDI